MADDVLLNAGSGGDTIAADDDGTRKHQYIKVEFGPDDTQTKVTASAGLPVTDDGSFTLAANSGVDIGDVDVTSVVPGTGATNAGKAVDTAAGATDTGSASLAVRDDALTTLTPVDGDYANLRLDANGALWVIPSGTVTVDGSGVTQPVSGTVTANAGTNLNTSALATSALQLADGHNVTVDNAAGAAAVNVQDGGNSLTVDNGGTFVVQEDGAALTALQLIDDVVHVDDTATHATGTTKGALVMAAATPTDGSVDANDIGALAMSIDRRLLVDSQIVGTDAALDVSGATVTTTPAVVGGGTEAAAQRVTIANDSTGVVSVDDGGSALTVDNGGTFLVQADSVIPGTGATNLGKAIDTAAGATDTGMASLAIRDDALTALTPVDGDYVPLRVNSTGALHVTGGGGGTQFNVDDVAGGTDAGTLALVVRDDALTTLTPVDGDYTQLRVNSTGALHVTGGGGGTEYVVNDVVPADPTGTASLMERDDVLSALSEAAGDWTNMRSNDQGALWVAGDGTFTVQEAAAMDVSAATVTTTPAVVGGGTEAAAQRVTLANDSTGLVSVDDGGGALTVDNGGTFVVQEDGAALTAIQLLDDIVHIDDTATHATGTTKGALIMGAATPTDGAVDANDIGALAMSVDRRLHTDAQIVGTDAALDVSGATVTTTPAVVGGGTEAAAQRVTLANDSTGVLSVDDNGGALTVDNGGTFATQATLQTGSALAGDVGLSGTRTSGGTTLYKNIDVDESEDQITASAGQIFWIHAMNLASATRFLKIYNLAAASVTVGTTVPDLTFPLPTQGDTNGAGFTLSIPNGIAFGTAITIAATNLIADSDATAPGANEVVVSIGYAT